MGGRIGTAHAVAAAVGLLQTLISSCAPLPAVMVRVPAPIRIIDAKTESPIEGAVILRSWNIRSAAMPSGGSDPLTFREARSNAVGDAWCAPVVRPYLNLVFIPFIFWNWAEENPTLVYKPGYKYVITPPGASPVALERVPDSFYRRSEEAEGANGFAYWNLKETMLMREKLAREAEAVKQLPRDVPGVLYSEGIRPPKGYYATIGDLAVDNVGRFHLAASAWPRSVSILSPSGEWTGLYLTNIDPGNRTLSGGGISLSSDEAGNVYVYVNGKISRFNQIGEVGPGEYVMMTKVKPYDGRFIVRGRDIFVVDVNDGSFLYHYDLGGNLVCQTQAEDDFVIRDLAFATDSDAILVVGGLTGTRNGPYEGRVIRYDPSCSKISSFALPWASFNMSATSIASLPRGGFIVSTGDRFYVYNPDSTLQFEETVGNREMGRVGISRVRSNAAGERLYFVDGAYGRLLVYDLEKREFPEKRVLSNPRNPLRKLQ